MDALSHGLAGALVGLGTTRRERVFTAACVGAALLPDLDGVLGLAGRELYFTQHRVLLHSLPAVLSMTALMAAGFVRWRGGTFYRVWAVFAAAALSHVLLDGVTSWGTVLLHPFSGRRFYLDLLFMFDVTLTAIFAVAVLGVWRVPARGRQIAVLGLLVGAGYLGLCAAARARVTAQVATAYPGEVTVVPQPWSPLSWAAFVVTDHGTRAGPVTLGGSRPELPLYPGPTSDPAFAAANATAPVRRFVAFARFPWVDFERRGEGLRLHYRDLRFEFSGMERSNWFYGVTVDLDGRGAVTAAGFTNPP